MEAKKLRILLTFLAVFMVFILSQIVEAAETGEKASFFEAMGIGLILFSLLYIGFSDWLYYNHIADEGIELKYNTFQKLGIFVSILFISIFISVLYNHFFDGNLGLYGINFYILVGVLYFITTLINKEENKGKQ